MTRAHRSIALAMAALAIPTAALAQNKPARPLFADDRPLHLALSGPIEAAGKTPVNATLATVGEATPERVAVTLVTRGITRKLHEICPFPPLYVTFPDKPPADSLFAKEKRLKLVTHCRPAPSFQQYQLLELAAYRMYELLTPVSFKTRLATIDYIGKGGKPIATRTGFFIETIEDVARRNGTVVYKTTAHVPSTRINARDAARYALFQLMIGNLDWAMNAGPAGANCCHNSKLLGDINAAGGLVPVPYDYDFSGMVDAPYATPPQNIDVANVRVRRYRGYCRSNGEVVMAAAAAFTERRQAIMAVLDTLPGLDDKPRAKARAYLDTFFDQIATPQGIQRLTATCVG